MIILRRLLFFVATGMVGLGADASAMLGTWLTPEGRSKVEIKKCEDRYCGVLVWMKNPKNDENNADAALRGRPLVGLALLTGVKADGTGGKIYAPERGRTLDAKVVAKGPDELEIRVSAGMVKRTITWTRAK